MNSHTLSGHHIFTIQRLVARCGLALILALALVQQATQRGHAAGSKRQHLSFVDRVAAQRAIEEVYHRHRIWPADNPEPKPPLDLVLPEEALRAKVKDYLRLSSALEVYWQGPINAADLQAEVERMARDTRQPEVLSELWAALGNDPALIAECLARPLLVEWLVRMRFEDCGVRNEGCEALGLMNPANPHEGQPKLKLTLTEALQKEPQFDPQLSQSLWHAARRGDLTALTSLLDKSVDIDAKNATGITALMMATANGHAEVVSALLAKGANINARDDDGRTALLLAAFYNHNDILQTLLAVNPDWTNQNKVSLDWTNQNKDGMTPLMVAAFRANLTAVNALIAKGANPQARENEGMTVLMWAVISGDVKIIEAILAQKVDVNAKSTAGVTALSLAKFKNNLQIEQMLTTNGAKAEDTGIRENMNPVSQAVVNIVNATVTLGAMNRVSKTISEREEQAGLNQLIDETTAQDVMDGKMNVSAIGSDGFTPLLRAASSGQGATAKALLLKGADPNTRSASGDSALMWAIIKQASHPQIIKALLDAGADVNVKSKNGGTPLMLAVTQGRIDIVKQLLDKGAVVKAKADDGTTAIKLAEKLAAQAKEIARRSGGIIKAGTEYPEILKLLKEAQKKQK